MRRTVFVFLILIYFPTLIPVMDQIDYTNLSGSFFLIPISELAYEIITIIAWGLTLWLLGSVFDKQFEKGGYSPWITCLIIGFFLYLCIVIP